jgi:WD40 repeat protein
MDMDDREEQAPENEAVLDEIVAAYLRDTDAGLCPDRSTLITKYPELASELIQFFQDRDRVDQWARPFRDAAAPSRVSSHYQCPNCSARLHPEGPIADCASCGARFHVEQEGSALLPINRRLDRYELRGMVGQGGFGTVYEAWDTELRRKVAIKIPRAGILQDDEDLERFLREARNAAGLHHPAIVQVLDVGKSNGLPYLVSDFVPGRALALVLKEGLLPFAQTAEVTALIAEALHYAHEKLVIHRDVKPSNIVLGTDGRPCLMDFGLALSSAGEPTITQDGRILGTPAYMSPEQARGKSHEVDGRADIYSLGAVLYHLLLGREPFGGSGQMILYQILHEDPLPLRRINKAIPLDLETICLKCLQKDPHRRYQTARDLALDLRRFRDGEPISTRPFGLADYLVRWMKRNPFLASISGLAAVLLIGTSLISAGWGIHANRLTKSIQNALSESEQRRAENQLDRGIDKAEHGDVGLGLLWMVRALETAPANAPDLIWAIRANFASWKTTSYLLTKYFTVSSRKPMAFTLSPASLWQVEENDHFVSKYDIVSQKQNGPRLEHDAKVSALAVGGAGKWLATGTTKGDVFVWNASTGNIHRKLQGSGSIYRIALSANGRMLVVAKPPKLLGNSSRTVIQAWDIETAARIGPPSSVAREIQAAALSPDGEVALFVPLLQKEIDCHEVATGRLLKTILPHDGSILALAFSGDGRLILTGAEDRTARLWDYRTGNQLAVLYHREPVKEVAFGNDNGLLQTASPGDGVRFWTGPKATAPINLVRHPEPVRTLTFDENGPYLASGCDDGVVRIWKLSGTGLALHNELPHRFPIASSSFSRDGRYLATTVHLGKMAALWGLPTGILVALLPHPADVRSATIRPDGQQFATVCHDLVVRLWQTADGSPATPHELLHPGRVTAALFAPNGKEILTASVDGIARIWDAATGELLRQTGSQESQIVTIAFDNAGKTFVTGTTNGAARVWDTATCSCIHTLCNDAYTVYAATYSPDNAMILTGSFDHTARLWQAQTGAAMGIPLRHSGPIRSIAFHDQGHLLGSTSKDFTARLWHTATGRAIGPALHHNTPVEASCFCSTDWFATGSLDGSVRMWQVPTPETDDIDAMRFWIQYATGLTLHAGGATQVLDSSGWSQLQARLLKATELPLANVDHRPESFGATKVSK